MKLTANVELTQDTYLQVYKVSMTTLDERF